MNPDSENQIELIFQPFGADKAQAEIQKIIAHLEKANAASARMEKQFVQTQGAIKKLSIQQEVAKPMQTVVIAAEDLDAAFKRLEDTSGKAFRATLVRDQQDEIKRAAEAAEQYKKVVEELGTSSTFAADAVRAAFRNARDEAEDTIQAFKEALSVSRDGGGGSPAARGRGRRNLLQTIGSEVRALPSVPLGGGLSTDVVGKLTATLGGLGAAGTAAALGIGAAIVALKSATAGIEQTVKAIIASQEEYYRALKTGTQESIQAAIEARKIEIDITRARIEEYQRLFANLESQVGTVGRGIADALNLGGARQLREETQKLEAELRNLEFGLGRLEQAAQDSDVATRSAAEAERKLAEERQRISDLRIQSTLAAELAIVDMTGEAVQKRLDAVNREMHTLLRFSRNVELSDEAVKGLSDRIQALAAESQVLADNLDAALSKDAVNALAEFGQRAVELEAQHKDKLTQIVEQGNKQIQNAEQQLAKAREALARFDAQQVEKQDKASADFMAKELERTRKFNRDMERAKEDSNRRLLQLSQKLEDDQFEAELANDVGAFQRAQRNFERAAEQERDNLSITQQRKLDDFREESAAAANLLKEKLDALAVEGQARRAELQATLQERQAALDAVKKEIGERLAAEVDAYRAGLQALVNAMDKSVKDMTGVITQGFKIVEAAGISTFTAWMQDLQRKANMLVSSQFAQLPMLPSTAAGAGTGVSPIKRLIGFADGGIATRPTLSLLGEKPGWGDLVIPFRQSDGYTPGGMGGPTIHVSVNAAPGLTNADRDRIKGDVYSAVATALSAAHNGKVPA